jgi:membrane protein DedA with SNARE-associated domain
VIAAGFFNARGNIGLSEIYISLSVGSIVGIWLTFYFGRLIAKQNIKLPGWSAKLISAQEILKINQWYKKYGYGLILINRFFPGIRSLFFVAAGMSNMPFGPVLITGSISAMLFNSMLLAVGYLAGQNMEIITNFLHQYTIVAYSILGAFIAIFIVIFYLKRKKSE